MINTWVGKAGGEGWVMPTENNDKETPFLYVNEKIKPKNKKGQDINPQRRYHFTLKL